MSLTVSASGITFDDLTTLSTASISASNLARNSVGTLQLSAGAVTTDKIALGAVITEDIANGAVTPLKLAQPLTLATAQNATGTSIDFTGIPSWAKRITLAFNSISTNGSSVPQVQLGSGSITTSGYVSNASFITSTVGSYTSTTGLVIAGATSGNTRTGIMTIMNISGSLWIASNSGSFDGETGTLVGGGKVTLPGALDRLRLTTINGTDTFDSGSINIMYEG